MQLDFDNADRRLDEVMAWLDAALEGKRGGDADDSMAAHAQVSSVVEEDDRGRASGVDRLEEKCTDQHIGAAGLAQDGAAVEVVLGAQEFESLGQRPGAQEGPPGDYGSGRFSRGVRVDHFYTRW
jgi:hypothetical protein